MHRTCIARKPRTRSGGHFAWTRYDACSLLQGPQEPSLCRGGTPPHGTSAPGRRACQCAAACCLSQTRNCRNKATFAVSVIPLLESGAACDRNSFKRVCVAALGVPPLKCSARHG